MCSDMIFYSFGLYILGLVLLFASYDILLRIIHDRRKRTIGLIFCCFFLCIMGIVLFILSVLLLIRVYSMSKILFIITTIFFLAVGVGTYFLMKWKRQIIKETRNHG